MIDRIVRYNFAYRHLYNDSGPAMFKTDPVDSKKIFKIFIDEQTDDERGKVMSKGQNCNKV
jgi:hypothetical protein